MDENMHSQTFQDRSIYLHEEWELAYWTYTLGVSKEQLHQAVQVAGTGATAVKRILGIQPLRADAL